MVRDEIRKIIKKAVKDSCLLAGEVGAKLLDFSVEKPREKSHGDYSTNVALVGAKLLKKNPMKIAEEIKAKIKTNIFDKVEIVKPGFINFFLSRKFLQDQGAKLLEKELSSLIPNIGKKQKINIEFISANPTGPLTLGNARGGFGGDVLSNVLEKAGYDVCREFYVNDQGKQIKDLKKGLYKGEKRTASQIQKENQKFITKNLNVKFDVWFSEKSLYNSNEVNIIIAY